MSESINVPKTSGSKEERKIVYDAIFPQIKALLAGESDPIANMANLAAALREAFHFFWVGFYLVKEGELVLGPFQGPVACTRIAFKRGVCGACYTTQQTMLVPNVNEFPGHIACSSKTRSEIVIPVFRYSEAGVRINEVIAVLDVDSERLDDFTEVDRVELERVVQLLA